MKETARIIPNNIKFEPVAIKKRKIHKAKLIIALCFVMVFVALCNTKEAIGYKFENVHEIDNQILITNDSKLVFFQNDKGIYQRHVFDLNTNKIINSSNNRNNLSTSFYYEGKLYNLSEDGLTGKFRLDSSCKIDGLNDYYKKVISSPKGDYLLLHRSDENSLIIKSTKIKETIKLSNVGDEFLGAAFSEDEKFLLLSCGVKFIRVNLHNFLIEDVNIFPKERKTNPYIFKNRIYFSSYGNGEHASIFSCPIEEIEEKKCITEVSSNNDLRLGKVDEKYIYYIEISNSQYLLKYKNIGTGEIKNITTIGVVYDYYIWKNKIIFVYSDLYTPRCIKSFDTVDKGITDLVCTFNSNRYSAQLIQKRSGGLSAYQLSLHNDSVKLKGVILYFHPGNRSDFSPRWDNMLLPFCDYHYLIIAPNFHTSTGYGKLYETSSFEDAVADMIEWYREIRMRFPDLPIFFYGISSGCLIMEACFTQEKININGIISCFGLSQRPFLSSTPQFYLLGKFDPIIHYESRIVELKQLTHFNSSIQILSLDKEKHWIQYPENFYLFYNYIVSYLDNKLYLDK